MPSTPILEKTDNKALITQVDDKKMHQSKWNNVNNRNININISRYIENLSTVEKLAKKLNLAKA